MDRRRTLIGAIVTFLYLAVVVLLSWNGRQEILKLAPNEVGDYLAGIFGPLAVLWLILGYLQQGEELRQSTMALAQQAVELRKSVEQQQALVEVSRAQVEAQTRAFEADSDRWKASWQPSFVLSLKKTYRDADGSYTFVVLCRNEGKGAVEVHLEVQGRLVAASHRRFPDFQHGDEMQFDLVDLEPDNFAPVHLHFSYTDVAGHLGRLSRIAYFHPEPPSGFKTVRFNAAPVDH